jgi:hypothetical protein
MKERSRFEVCVIGLLVVIIILQVTILFKQFQMDERIIEALKGLYFDFAQLVG